MSQQQQRLAILVGGGPAPGINSVISAATIRAILEGVEVLGIRDGFEWIMKGDDEFKQKFEYLIANELPPIVLGAETSVA